MTPPSGKNPRGHGCVALISAVLSLVRIEAAQAQSQTLLSWDAPASCPQGDEVMAAVREIAGDKVLATTSLHATGNIRRIDDKFRLDLVIQSENGTYNRTLDARNCGDLLNAAAVVLGLNLKRANADETEGKQSEGAAEATSAAGGLSSSDKPVTGSEQNGAPSVVSAPNPTTAKPVSSDETAQPKNDTLPLGVWVGIPQVQGALGALSDPTLWWSLSVGKRVDPWMVWLAARYHSPQAVASDEQSDVGARVIRYGGEVGFARSFRGSQFEWAPGVLLQAEHLIVRGTGQDLVATSVTSNIVLIGMGVTARWFATDWFGLALALGIDVPMSRPRFEVQRLGTQGQFGPVIGRLSLGLEWNF